MGCISWNCRGPGNPRTVRALNDLLKDHKPSFLFLIELISFANKIEELRVRFCFDSCFLVNRVGRSGGLAVLWKCSMQCEITGYSQQHINVLFSENGHASWRLSYFYGFSDRTRRRDSWDLIFNRVGRSGGLAVLWKCSMQCEITGYSQQHIDVLFSENGHASWRLSCFYGFPDRTRRRDSWDLIYGLGKVIDDCYLFEHSMSGGKFTWEKSRGSNAWVREKLDRGFANFTWWNKFPMYSLKVFHTSVSDHEPILLEFFKADISKKTFRFRFENMWLRDPNFVKEVSDVWKTIPILHLLPKLFEISSFMACWGRSFFHKFREKVKEHKAVINRVVDCCDENSVRLYLEEKKKLNILLLQEQTYWKQRAKLFWLQEGDENTRFFHSSASARKKTNKVDFLINDAGTKVEDHERMYEVVRDYFTALFTGEVNTLVSNDLNGHIIVFEDQNRRLVEDFSFEEFTLAVK
ncbi:uncharacterized protein LOC141663760 [Apium graveolens]|uniref:uncharacterized protein LOC141663760 n=1 Tax=Apium graveolens TaxID=4045 RepID=UPI003D7A09BF